MTSLVQKGDLNATSFANTNTANAGGISIRVDAASTVGQAIATAVAAGGVGGGAAATTTTPGIVKLTNAAPVAAGDTSTTATTPAFVADAIATTAATTAAPGSVKLTNALPVAAGAGNTTAATPDFVAASISAATIGGGAAATTTTPGIVQLTNAAPSTSATTAATPAFVNAAIAAAGGGTSKPEASSAEIQSGHPDKLVTADDLATALATGVDHKVKSTIAIASGNEGAITGINTSSATTGAVGGHFEITAGGSGAAGVAHAVVGTVSNTSAGIESAGVFGTGYGEANGVRGVSAKSAGVSGVYFGSEGSAPVNTYSSGVFGWNSQGSNVPAVKAYCYGTGAGNNGVAIEAVTVPAANCATAIRVEAGTGTPFAITTNKNIQVAGTTVTSDRRLKREITDVDGARAAAFISALKVKSYVKLQAEAGVKAAYALELEDAKRTVERLHSELAAMPSVRDGAKIAEIMRQLGAADAVIKRNGVAPDEALVLGREVGFIAQDVQELVQSEFKEFSHVVSLSNPRDKDSMLVLDYNSLNGIFIAAVQYKLFA